ncbi:TVP38/TMEM64 family membrane protein slr0305-like isoform X4 [Mangifera indica]|uniref:TVP38/TMEM64 family membrane protein slr0305-like isoform X4 n=1 Tax=Mangifera indica TaxID=29780 RepID=UPI001CFC09B6|nr:TVP38/TMEM64 family membrane protein slr0305-like isoform X4 [Mangifera indica]
MAMAFISRACCRSAFRIILLLLLFAFICIACVCLPVEKILQEFLLWIKQDLGPWGPVVMTAAYTPLAIFAIPTSILSLGGGYLYGLPLGFAIDSVGATVGATAAFLIGRTIVFLLRLAPLLPFTVLNYFLSVAPVHIGEYMLASWLGIMPSTFAFVYVGTTLTDLSDVMHGWNEISTTRRVLMALGFVMSVILIMCITKVAKASLDKALVENSEKRVFITTMLPIVVDSSLEVQKPLIQIGLREEEEENEKQRLI